MAGKIRWHFIAIPEAPDQQRRMRQRDTIWDMLRYDRCHPVSNAPSGWIVLVQEPLKDMKGGFTIPRWNSFGFRIIYLWESATSQPGLAFYQLLYDTTAHVKPDVPAAETTTTETES